MTSAHPPTHPPQHHTTRQPPHTKPKAGILRLTPTHQHHLPPHPTPHFLTKPGTKQRVGCPSRRGCWGPEPKQDAPVAIRPAASGVSASKRCMRRKYFPPKQDLPHPQIFKMMAARRTCVVACMATRRLPAVAVRGVVTAPDNSLGGQTETKVLSPA